MRNTNGLRLSIDTALGVVGVLSLLAAPAAARSAEPTTLAADTADTVVVVVSAESPIVEIPRMHLADLYLGRAARFPDGEKARPIDQAPGSGERAAFYEGYLGRSPSQIKAHWSKIIFTGRGRPPKDVADAEAVKRLVAADPSAVGYIDAAHVDDTVRVLRVH